VLRLDREAGPAHRCARSAFVRLDGRRTRLQPARRRRLGICARLRRSPCLVGGAPDLGPPSVAVRWRAVPSQRDRHGAGTGTGSVRRPPACQGRVTAVSSASQRSRAARRGITTAGPSWPLDASCSPAPTHRMDWLCPSARLDNWASRACPPAGHPAAIDKNMSVELDIHVIYDSCARHKTAVFRLSWLVSVSPATGASWINLVSS
jgi:hypothetical protein